MRGCTRRRRCMAWALPLALASCLAAATEPAGSAPHVPAGHADAPVPGQAVIAPGQRVRATAIANAATSPEPALAATGGDFSVVTLNLYHDRDDWPRRRVQIVETLRLLQPDAVALQEVLEHPDLPNQAAWLAHELGYAWHFFTRDPPSRSRRYGNALLTRAPAVVDGETLLHPLDDHRVAGMVRIMVGQRPVNIYVTHLHWTPEGDAIRARQVEDLVAWIDATAGEAPSLVAGDFNAGADAAELAPLRARFDDAWTRLHPAATDAGSSTLNPHYFPQPARIDHVHLQRGRLKPVTAALLFTAPDADGTWASDHRGLLVGVELEEAADPSIAAPVRDAAHTP